MSIPEDDGLHTAECLEYAAKTGKSFCIAQCGDARRLRATEQSQRDMQLQLRMLDEPPRKAWSRGYEYAMLELQAVVKHARLARDAYLDLRPDERPGWWRFLDEPLSKLDDPSWEEDETR